MLDTVSTSERPVSSYQTTRRSITEDSRLRGYTESTGEVRNAYKTWTGKQTITVNYRSTNENEVRVHLNSTEAAMVTLQHQGTTPRTIQRKRSSTRS